MSITLKKRADGSVAVSATGKGAQHLIEDAHQADLRAERWRKAHDEEAEKRKSIERKLQVLHEGVCLVARRYPESGASSELYDLLAEVEKTP